MNDQAIQTEDMMLAEFVLKLTESELADYNAGRKVVKTNGKSEFVLVPNPDNYHSGQYRKVRRKNTHLTPKMKKITVTIALNFYEDGSEDAAVETKNVPKSIILEKLQTLSKGFAQQIVRDAGFVPDSNLENYLDARISIDRNVLKTLFQD